MNATNDRMDYTLTALADPTRRAIFQRLASGEACVTELAKPFEMSLNAVSKHIRMLERARLIKRRIEGREHFLSVNPDPLNEVVNWIETQRAIWNTRLDTLESILRAEDQANRKLGKRSSRSSNRKKKSKSNRKPKRRAS